MSFQMRIGPKLLLMAFMIGLLPVMAIGLFALNQSADSIIRHQFDKLEGVRSLKKAHIEHFFDERKRDLNQLMTVVV